MTRIVMVGPGSMPIPSAGWGAIETVIWNLTTRLRVRGHRVLIVNSPSKAQQLASLAFRPSVVHVHFDAYLPLWRRIQPLRRPTVISTSHNPYAGWPELWSPDMRASFERVFDIDHHFALSPEIASVIRRFNSGARCLVVPNGVDVASHATSSHRNGRALCLGRWEDRKRQQDLWELLAAEGDVPCDFVGPGTPTGRRPSGPLRVLGTWDSDTVRARLGGYSCLVLPSHAEAHALVVLEALASGVPVVVTPRAASNLDLELPWVEVQEFGPQLIEALRRQTRSSPPGEAIRRYAAEAFDWERVVDTYENALEQWTRL